MSNILKGIEVKTLFLNGVVYFNGYDFEGFEDCCIYAKLQRLKTNPGMV
jgi:hypothetical protein